MKTFLLFSFVVVSFMSFLACNDSGTNTPARNNQQELGNMSLLLSSPPPEIVRVTATISRQGFDTSSINLTIDSAQTAAGAFDNVAVGTWHLKVEAFDIGDVVRFAGETNVEVRPGQIAQVNLQLLPTSGGIHIVVTWGGMPVPGGGLMAYYPLNGNATDASGNGNDGAVSGAIPVPDRHGVQNGAMWFDGIDDHITIASSQSLHPMNQLTIVFWVRVDSMNDNYLSLLQKTGPIQQTPWLANREYVVHLKENMIPVQFYFQTHSAGDGSEQHSIFSNTFPIRQWIFFTAVIDRQNHAMKTYVNGVLNSEVYDSYSSFNANGYPLLIGTEIETWPDHSPFFGVLDELRLYNKALTTAEIQELYNMP